MSAHTNTHAGTLIHTLAHTQTHTDTQIHTLKHSNIFRIGPTAFGGSAD